MNVCVRCRMLLAFGAIADAHVVQGPCVVAVQGHGSGSRNPSAEMEGKIKGRGTVWRLGACLHVGEGGTAWRMARAAPGALGQVEKALWRPAGGAARFCAHAVPE